MLERIAVDAEADVRLVGRLRVDLHPRVAVHAQPHRLGLAGLRLWVVTEQLGDTLVQAVANLPADADDHARRLVPVADVRPEAIGCRAADRLLAADDVPAERLVAVA